MATNLPAAAILAAAKYFSDLANQVIDEERDIKPRDLVYPGEYKVSIKNLSLDLSLTVAEDSTTPRVSIPYKDIATGAVNGFTPAEKAVVKRTILEGSDPKVDAETKSFFADIKSELIDQGKARYSRGSVKVETVTAEVELATQKRVNDA